MGGGERRQRATAGVEVGDDREIDRRGRIVATGEHHLAAGCFCEARQPVDLADAVGPGEQQFVAAHASAFSAAEDEEDHGTSASEGAFRQPLIAGIGRGFAGRKRLVRIVAGVTGAGLVAGVEAQPEEVVLIAAASRAIMEPPAPRRLAG